MKDCGVMTFLSNLNIIFSIENEIKFYYSFQVFIGSKRKIQSKIVGKKIIERVREEEILKRKYFTVCSC